MEKYIYTFRNYNDSRVEQVRYRKKPKIINGLVFKGIDDVDIDEEEFKIDSIDMKGTELAKKYNLSYTQALRLKKSFNT